MKKVLLSLILLFFIIGIIGIAFAAQGDSNSSQNKSGQAKNESADKNMSNKNNSQGIGQELSEMIRARKEILKAGNYTGALGQLLRVREMVGQLKELRVNNIAATTDLNITAETDEQGKTKLKVKLKNGEEREIKIMPDTASERALERLKLKVCSADNNCTIQLKDVGERTQERLQYEIQIERHSRILGIFQKKMQVRAEVNAETGDVKTKKPWWAFLATEPSE